MPNPVANPNPTRAASPRPAPQLTAEAMAQLPGVGPPETAQAAPDIAPDPAPRTTVNPLVRALKPAATFGIAPLGGGMAALSNVFGYVFAMYLKQSRIHMYSNVFETIVLTVF